VSELKRLESPAFVRNKEPIAQAMRQVMPTPAVVLELGSGPGQHACYLAKALGVARWYPSEVSEQRLDSIRGWRELERVEGLVAAPRVLDLLSEAWWSTVKIEALNMIVAINVAHIVSWAGVCALLEGAGRLLSEGGVLYLYGPYRYQARELEPSNEAFDQSLRAQVPGAGIKVFEEVVEQALVHGMELWRDEAMPANNRSLSFRRV
jgi:SAM-dependent methyltransferase